MARSAIRAALLAILALCLSATVSQAAQSARITASFSPYRLGAATSATLGFQISSPGGGIPAPLTGIDFSYPRNLGIATSGLGIASCDPLVLEMSGPSACPANSIMGSGSAAVEVPLGPEVVRENASIGIVAGPSPDGRVRLLVSATGIAPVAARIVMPTLLEGGHLHITVPLVESLPDGPNVAVVRVSVKLGGNLTYYERRGRHTVRYRPKGVTLPNTCPRGGFPFTASFTFADGESTSARYALPCPRRH